MIFYLTNLFVFIIYSFFIYLICRNKEKVGKIVVTLFCVHFGTIMALRSVNVGADVDTYSKLFSIISYSDAGSMFNVIKSAPLYIIYNKVISFISTNPQAIIISNSIIITLLIGLFIYRNSSNVIMSCFCYVALYFYFTSFNISRQFIAIALVANSLYYVRNNKIVKFFIVIGISTLIHNTAIVGLILLPLSKIKWNNIRISIFTAITVIVMFLYQKILNLFLIIFPRYLMYVNGDSKFSLTDVGQGRKIILSFFYLIVVILCIIFLSKTKKKKELFNVRKELYVLTSIIIIAVVGGIIFYNNLLIGRIILYFSIFVIVYIPVFIKAIPKNMLSKLVLYYSSYIILLVPLLVQLKDNISEVVPYIFFWK